MKKIPVQKTKSNRTDRKTIVQLNEAKKLVYELMMKGWTHYQISSHLMETGIYRSYAGCVKIIDKVNKEVGAVQEKDIEKLKTKYLEMYETLYNAALQKEDVKGACMILNSLVKLQGLDIQKVEAKITTTFDVQF